jgi:hypothetical protein
MQGSAVWARLYPDQPRAPIHTAIYAPWECLFTTNKKLSAESCASADSRLVRLCYCTRVGDDPVEVCPTTSASLAW